MIGVFLAQYAPHGADIRHDAILIEGDEHADFTFARAQNGRDGIRKLIQPLARLGRNANAARQRRKIRLFNFITFIQYVNARLRSCAQLL